MNMESYKSKKSLLGQKKYYKEIFTLLISDNLNNPILLSGKKGIGKFTLIYHIISKILDKDNYDSNLYLIKKDNLFFSNITDKVSDNFIYLSGENKNINIDKIRQLRSDISKSTINNKKRFIILDDIDLFNINCSNALLKTIEEPTRTNQFILINNKSKELLETIKSRCLEIKIFLTNNERDQIINDFIKIYEINNIIDYKDTSISPGDFLIFNKICLDKNIDINGNLRDNVNKLISLFKLHKELKYLNLLIYIVDQYYYNASKNKKKDLYIIRTTTIKKIFDFNNLNLNNINLVKDIENNL